VAQLLAAQPSAEVHVREVARRLCASPAAAGAALRRLESEGVLTSHWVGRNRVYRSAAGRSTAPAGADHGIVVGGPRRMTTRFPASPAEWELRPYFLWDRDLSWREFRDLVGGPELGRSAWAVARLLDHARWGDVWRLATPDQVRRELPNIRVRHAAAWKDILEPGRAAG